MTKTNFALGMTKIRTAVTVAMLLAAPQVYAAEYKIDPAHSFVAFKIQHLGYSWMYGQFNEVSGSFTWDENDPGSAKVSVDINPASVDTNHEKRDEHIRSADMLAIEKFGDATFESTGYAGDATAGVLTGNLTVRGETKPIEVNVLRIGEGKDPWGGYRAGFLGTYEMKRADFGENYQLGPASENMQFEISIEGIRQ